MKKYIFTIILTAFAMLSAVAQKAWTVEKVPNTRLQSDFIHVSDPDGYISANTEMKINTALCAIRDQADVFLVCLNSIGEYAVPKDFAIDLFKYWGIGDKGKDNGLLLLFVEDQHAFEFETGYGIEGTLPDAVCFQIFDHTIKPCFKKGDYEGGMYAGVLDIVEVFGGTIPDGLITVLPDEQVYQNAKPQQVIEEDAVSDFYMYFMVFFCILIPVVSFLRYASGIKKNKNKGEINDKISVEEKDGLKYLNEASTSWSGSAWEGAGCAKAATFGLSALVWLFVMKVLVTAAMPAPEEQYAASNIVAVSTMLLYFTWICVMHNRRTLKMADKVAQNSLRPKMVYDKAKKYPRTQLLNYLAYWVGWYFIKKYEERKVKCIDMICPDCHQIMDFDPSVTLPAVAAAENACNARVYTAVRCPSGHTYVLKDKGKAYDKYNDCPHCGAHLDQSVNTRLVKSPTYYSTGLKEIDFECQFCHHKSKKQIILPRKERTTSSGGFGGGGSRSSGGSFGGGRSGGGGFSGRW